MDRDASRDITAPEQSERSGGHAGQEEEEKSAVKTGMGMPKRIEEVIGAPIENEGRDGSDEEQKAKEEFAEQDSVHGLSLPERFRLDYSRSRF